MTDCTGYGFGSNVDLCLDGPIGDGNTANLDISISDTHGQNWSSSQSTTVSNWDGSAIVVDVTSLLRVGSYSFVGTNCDLTARVTIRPDGETDGGTILLEFIFENCAAPAAGDFGPDVFALCGGAGPHVVSEMSTFSFNEPACPIVV